MTLRKPWIPLILISSVPISAVAQDEREQDVLEEIFVTDLDRINEQFENQIGMEQIAPVYGLSVA